MILFICSSAVIQVLWVSTSIKVLQGEKEKIGSKVLTKQVIVLGLTRLTSSIACNC